MEETPNNTPITTESDVFSPSIFSQAANIAKEEGLTASPSATSAPVAPAFEIDEEVAGILVEVPFDVASFLTRMDTLALRDHETKKLAKLWRGPLQRILGKYENSDIGIAAVATLGIAFGKYEEYKLTIERRNRTRTEGSGENQPSQEQIP